MRSVSCLVSFAERKSRGVIARSSLDPPLELVNFHSKNRIAEQGHTINIKAVKVILIVACVFFLFLSAAYAKEEDTAQETTDDIQNPDSQDHGITEADAPKAQSSLNAIYKVDTSDTTDFNLDGNFEFRKGSHFLLGFEDTQSPPSTGQPSSLDTMEVRAGISGDFRDDFTYSVNYSIWGAPNQISTNTLGLEVKWIGDRWITGIQPQLRIIDVPVEIDAQIRKEEGNGAPSQVLVSDPSLTATLSYIGWDPWTIKFMGAYFAYSLPLAEIFSTNLSRFFSSSSVNGANNFNEMEASIEVNYGFKYFSIGFEYMYAISALDYTVQPTYTGKTTYFFIKDLDVELDGGQTPGVGIGSPPVDFVSLGLTTYW